MNSNPGPHPATQKKVRILFGSVSLTLARTGPQHDRLVTWVRCVGTVAYPTLVFIQDNFTVFNNKLES
jgi:hypothetical protein